MVKAGSLLVSWLGCFFAPPRVFDWYVRSALGILVGLYIGNNSRSVMYTSRSYTAIMPVLSQCIEIGQPLAKYMMLRAAPGERIERIHRRR